MKYFVLCLIFSHHVFAFKTLRHNYDAYKDSKVPTRFNKNTPDYQKSLQNEIDTVYGKKPSRDSEIVIEQMKKDNNRLKIETENTLIQQQPARSNVDVGNQEDVRQNSLKNNSKSNEDRDQDKRIEYNMSRNRMSKEDLQKIMKVSVAPLDKKSQTSLNYSSLGHFAIETGFFESAIYFFEMALKAKPDDLNSILGKAVAYHKLKQYNEAFRFYSLVLRNSSSNKIATSNIISILSNVDVSSAMERVKPLYKANPDRHDIVALMGVIYARSGYTDEGIELLSKAVKLNPANSSYNYNLAILYDKIDDKKQAVYYYKRALDNKSPAFGINYNQVQDRIKFLNTKK